MTMTSWTPGPWQVTDDGTRVVSETRHVPSLGIRRRLVICEAPPAADADDFPGSEFRSPGLGEWAANARLISAAPELVAALRALCAALPPAAALPTAAEEPHGLPRHIDSARALLARLDAEGAR